MKKFLDLKKSIIDSKNQPTLIQTYLDSIRSSCYKLASPQVTPRGKQNIKTNLTNSTKSKKKIVYKCNLQDLMSGSTPVSNDNHSNLKEQSHLDQIFSRLSSSCKPIQTSQQEILTSILQSLDQLPKNKQYEQSILLIKNIISILPHANFKVNNDIEYSCPKNGFNTTTHDISPGVNDSHLKSCIHLEEDGEKAERSMSKTNIKMDWPKNQIQHQSPVKSTKIKYQVYANNATIQTSQDSIQISDSKSNSSSNSDLDNTMRSQDLNNWKQKSLSCISELDQNQQSNQDDSSFKKYYLQVPQETIEFKKIQYMLDSGSTYKKSQQKIIIDQSRSSSKKLFSNQINSASKQALSFEKNSQQFPSTSTSKPPHKHTLSDPHLSKLHNKSSSSTDKNDGFPKIEQKSVSEFNDPTSGKRKALKQIMNMLNLKHKRTVKLNNNFI